MILSEASIADLDAIIHLLTDDPLGSTREQQSTNHNSDYLDAFHSISADKNAALIVGRDNDRVIAVAQINFIQNLTYQGGLRAQIEGVRVHQSYRSQGVGKTLFEHLISLAQQRGCHMVQLTTDKSRPDAFAFYQSLGFTNSHEGFKLHLTH